MLASHYGRHDTAALLIDLGANPNAIDRWGRTALRDAAFAGDVPMAQIIVGGDLTTLPSEH